MKRLIYRVWGFLTDGVYWAGWEKGIDVGVKMERERVLSLIPEIRKIAIKTGVKGGPLNFEKADQEISNLIDWKNKK